MIKTALVGYGWWGQHMARLLRDSRFFELSGIYAPELAGESEIDGIPIYSSMQALLNDGETAAVILTSPNLLHEEQAVAAAEAGKHVFCEKPLSLTAASAGRIVATCANAGRVLAVGHERRFEPAMQRVAELVRSQSLGTIMHAEAAFSHDKLATLDQENWRAKKATAPAAGMTGMGIHLTDFFIWMFGPVKTVQALTADRTLGWETGDLVTVQLQFEAGMTATLSAILNTPHFIRYHVFGSDKWVEVRNDTHPDTPGGEAHLCLSESGREMQFEHYPWTDTVSDNLHSFAKAITGEAPYPFSDFELRHNIEVLEAIIQSADTGETVRL